MVYAEHDAAVMHEIIDCIKIMGVTQREIEKTKPTFLLDCGECVHQLFVKRYFRQHSYAHLL